MKSEKLKRDLKKAIRRARVLEEHKIARRLSTDILINGYTPPIISQRSLTEMVESSPTTARKLSCFATISNPRIQPLKKCKDETAIQDRL